MWDNLKEFLAKYFNRLLIPRIHLLDWVEILLIAFVLYHLIKWIKRTRAWYLVKGMVILVVVWVLVSLFRFTAIQWIFVNTINVGIIAIFIIFQPELRRALEQLGQRRLLSFFGDSDSGERYSDETRDEILTGVFEMAKVKTGALICLEGVISLEDYERSGIPTDSVVTAALLINIFEKNTPLHDGAVIIRGNRAAAATCILPVSENMRLSKDLGTRHRAGVGLSEITDALVIIVSEENGKVSLAQKGQLIRGVDREFLSNKLLEFQNKPTPQSRLLFRKEREKDGKKA
ncbi:MAG: diadenylate cyclase CdaA [Lachnospiraceae bacterium]|nr:diadenylate cyclase CdaA [Lachnospiraceae bacterium]MBR5667126.1 diadenylate cyclase CdaA [Lachnospiraceae bacterium]